jgi:hypothetical protein
MRRVGGEFTLTAAHRRPWRRSSASFSRSVTCREEYEKKGKESGGGVRGEVEES